MKRFINRICYHYFPTDSNPDRFRELISSITTFYPKLSGITAPTSCNYYSWSLPASTCIINSEKYTYNNTYCKFYFFHWFFLLIP